MIELKEAGHIDFPTTCEAYRKAGKPRAKMLTELRIKIEAVCPDLTRDQLDEQIRLAANAIFAEFSQPTYNKGEAFRG